MRPGSQLVIIPCTSTLYEHEIQSSSQAATPTTPTTLRRACCLKRVMFGIQSTKLQYKLSKQVKRSVCALPVPLEPRRRTEVWPRVEPIEALYWLASHMKTRPYAE